MDRFPLDDVTQVTGLKKLIISQLENIYGASTNRYRRFDILFLRNGPNILVARAIGYTTTYNSGWEFLLEGTSGISVLGALEELWNKVLAKVPASAQKMKIGETTGLEYIVPA